MQTVQEGLAKLARRLVKGAIDNPAREARLLLAHQLEIDPSRLSLHLRDPLAATDLAAAGTLAQRRCAGEPISHIRGYRDFWGRRFSVDSRVLDPRPETEELIAESMSAPFSRVLDLGTGSGCILVTLLAEQSEAVGLGVDISEAALEIARTNAQSHAVIPRCEMNVSDWYQRVDGHFDLIVSNPPYIALSEMAALQSEVLAHEPRIALTDEADGLACYRRIAAGAPSHLAPGGRLLVEIGPSQGAAVAAMFDAAGLEEIAIRPDMDGRDRVVSARLGVAKR
ncbi:peptide chain release factor N(5)-glutamine methyltransferase [Tropicimonas sp. TH_r6]|uniref:peptide chain release factor N(5)-glutamine methyltransferase n=1 Tax=Tropicimonas sp. TH_r6 TaxID=3082085 RepID=UPI0029552611|nr:peptide chain release factor N(5)-glutamine methyltransferase [Tropicimonas sp. TH_r6]MDV7143812.1 peptide chain release factor N(5)-glutamine methyltransferase [Tropicimonas sp. TH_r6]